MLSKLLSLFRPKPQFRVGELVVRKEEEEDPKEEGEHPKEEEILRMMGKHPKRYLLIEGRRWLQLEGARKSEWVYDGKVYHIEDGIFKLYSPISCVTEDSLELIPRGW